MEEAQCKPRSGITHNRHYRPKAFIANHTQNQTSYKYPICKNNHSIYHCMKFKSMPIEIRVETVKQLNLCINCLHAEHNERRCKLSSYRFCSQRHNSMLHNGKKSNETPNT